jgi:predicted secreted protein
MERQDVRRGKLVVVVHCILNQNSRVSGLATYPAVVDEIVDILKKHNVGFLQMPCPELAYAGARRPGKNKAEYDRPRYRRLCRKIALSAVRQIEELAKGGVKTLALLGVKGSPSCDAGNSGEAIGILVEEVESALLEKGMRIPAHAINLYDVAADVGWLEDILRQG